MSKRRSLQLALLLGSIAACALAGEWLWRAAVRDRYRRDRAAFAEPMYDAVEGPEIYDLKRGLDHTDRIADPAGGPPTVVRYRTDDDRTPRHPVWPPPEGVRRVLFVGDSYTFGSCVPEDGSYVLQTQRELAAAGVAIFAINGGVPGYNSEQELAHLRRLLPVHAPTHVVLGFVMNDAEPPVTSTPPPEVVYGGVGSWLLADCRYVLGALTVALVDDRPPYPPLRRPYEGDYRLSWGPGSAKVRYRGGVRVE